MRGSQTLVEYFLALFVGETNAADLALGFKFFSKTRGVRESRFAHDDQPSAGRGERTLQDHNDSVLYCNASRGMSEFIAVLLQRASRRPRERYAANAFHKAKKRKKRNPFALLRSLPSRLRSSSQVVGPVRIPALGLVGKLGNTAESKTPG